MAGGNSDFEIRFKTTHENTGAEQAAQQIDKVKESSAGAKAVMKGLAFELPAVARFMGFLSNPLTLVSAGLGMVIGKLVDLKRTADEALALQGRINSVADSVMSIARRAADFTAKAEDFEKGLRKIATAS